jgi:hypothetical protein
VKFQKSHLKRKSNQMSISYVSPGTGFLKTQSLYISKAAVAVYIAQAITLIATLIIKMMPIYHQFRLCLCEVRD